MKKQILFLAAVCCMAFAFTNCGKDDEPKTVEEYVINAKVTTFAPGNNDIDSVYARLANERGEGSIIIGRAAYKNGEFTMRLPGELSAGQLHDLSIMPGEINASDKNIRANLVMQFEARKNGQAKGVFYCGKYAIPSSVILLLHLYADRPATFEGSFTEEDSGGLFPVDAKGTYNVSLKKGWNVIAADAKASLGGIFDASVKDISSTIGYDWIYFPPQ